MKPSARRNGRSAWTRSRTRSCAASAPACRGCTGDRRMSVVKRAGIAAGTAVGVAGATYAAQRYAARRIRRTPDDDARRALDAPMYIDHRIDTRDRGTIYAVENGDADAPPIVLSHGVTLSVRTWFH